MDANVVDVSDSSFQADVLQSTVPVLVDFWAPWCGPCRQIAPLIDQLAAENLNAVKVVKVNVDENGQTAMAYDVSSIPTLIIFRGGQPVQRFVGAQSKARLQDALDAAQE